MAIPGCDLYGDSRAAKWGENEKRTKTKGKSRPEHVGTVGQSSVVFFFFLRIELRRGSEDLIE